MFIRVICGLFTCVVFSDVPLLQDLEISLFEIEVRSGNYLPAFICSYPIDNLWGVGAEEDAVGRLERLAVFA